MTCPRHSAGAILKRPGVTSTGPFVHQEHQERQSRGELGVTESTDKTFNFKARYPDHKDVDSKLAVHSLLELSSYGPMTIITIAVGGAVRHRVFDTSDQASVEDMRSFIAFHETQPAQVFFMPNAVRAGCQTVPTTEDLETIRSVILDFDPDKERPLDEERDRLRMVAHDLITGPLPPRSVFDTGGGMQVVYQLLKPLPATPESIEMIEMLMRSLARSLGADTATCTAKNLFRVPGTYNWPTPAKKKAGRERSVSGIWHHGGPRCSLEELRALATVRVEDEPASAPQEFGDLGEHDLVAVLHDPSALPARLIELIRDPAMEKALRRPPPPGDRSGGDFALACSLARLRLPPADIAMLVSAFGHKVDEAFQQQRLFSYVVHTVKKAVDRVSPELLLGDFEDEVDAEEAEERRKKHIDRLESMDDDEIVEGLEDPDNDHLVQGLMRRGDLVVVYGKPGSGKTFVALDLGFRVAMGLEWSGCAVKQTSVVYIAAESPYGVRYRYKALRNRFGANKHFFMIGSTVNMFDPAIDIKPLIASIRKRGDVGLIIIDTLARTMIGGNENSTQDMSRLVANGDKLRDEFDAAVLWIHHTGKNEAAGARGSSALVAATDTEIEIADYTFRSTKMRDREPVDFRFQLKPVEAVTKKDGEVVHTCVVEWIKHTGPTGRSTPETDCTKMAVEFLRARGAPATIDDLWEDSELSGRKFPVKKKSLGKALERACLNATDGRFTRTPTKTMSGGHIIYAYGLANW